MEHLSEQVSNLVAVCEHNHSRYLYDCRVGKHPGTGSQMFGHSLSYHPGGNIGFLSSPVWNIQADEIFWWIKKQPLFLQKRGGPASQHQPILPQSPQSGQCIETCRNCENHLLSQVFCFFVFFFLFCLFFFVLFWFIFRSESQPLNAGFPLAWGEKRGWQREEHSCVYFDYFLLNNIARWTFTFTLLIVLEVFFFLFYFVMIFELS